MQPNERLPNAERAVVPPGKVEGYLLNALHVQNSGKAQFFERAGYNPEQPERLINDLKTIARTGRVTTTVTTPRGIKYVVKGTITAPNRREYSLQTVWIIDIDQEIPRFLTAYPNKK
jgi:hypothetical protein